ncbi:MAG: organic solvent tolerance protein [Sulfurimonas sp. RIFCSPLOWO2_12_36_12]|uniref:LPS-assembly protein LptD n=1 Tax=Sulfurimonas sp. RIFCSPLOWO2_12_36_12 TaxID=1802253 RepID=UPI0008B64D23|nr:LPS assembly protein LptD [Sulfurimonas sp. RIFCSPLOWO2_12_36_12]OHE00116.1 MAG: organic solvent tolerance protein [Sulfurimonas sp. RIFCSPLOWO2_12_36_12]
MFKFFIFLIVFITHLIGDDKVEIYATTMDTKDNIVTAGGEVVVVYQDYHLSAQRAIYDRNSSELELFGNIRASQGENIKLLGEYAKLNIAQKERTFKPFYMLEKTADVWISGDDGYAKDIEVEIKSGVMSGCDPNDPLWKMEFTSSEYNTDTMWLNLYNARIYIYDIPVFYTPYFGYSLDTTRRTGVLPPMVGFSSKEGFYYEQALYIAEQNWWDLELKPQIRTNRGSGMYTTFRFADSKISKGSLTAGYFKEKQEYFDESDLANNKHYGFNFLYENSDVINQWFGTKLEGQSGLYMDIVNMNDVDYINLSTNDTTQNATTTQLLSRINLFYNTDNNYFGSYFKHYKNLTLESNEKTLQNLPALHYHKYLETLFDEHFLYSLDVQSNNYYRTLGKSAVQTNINIPLTLQTSLFDEHLNISYKSYIYAQHTSFKGEEEVPTTDEYSSGFFARNYHVVSASTQLTRAFDEVTHVVDFGTQYQVGGSDMEDGYYDEQKDYCSIKENKAKPICEFYNITEIEKSLQLYFSHYLYNISGKQIFYHRVAQNISYEGIGGGAGELENELDYQMTDSLNYYNNMFYNYDEGAFSKNFNKILYKNNTFNIGLSHMYKNTFLPYTTTTSPITSYITSSIGYKYNNHYSYSFKHDYDLERSEKKGFEVGFLYQKRCWDFGLRYVESNRPILSLSGVSDSIYDRYIYLTIRLKPIMSPNSTASGFSYRLPDKSGTN